MSFDVSHLRAGDRVRVHFNYRSPAVGILRPGHGILRDTTTALFIDTAAANVVRNQEGQPGYGVIDVEPVGHATSDDRFDRLVELVEEHLHAVAAHRDALAADRDALLVDVEDTRQAVIDAWEGRA